MFREGYPHASRLSGGSRAGRGSPRPGCSHDEEHGEASFNAPRRYRAGFVTRSRCAPQRLQCKSPSTDSTTSLAQLREKLTVLSPLVFNKVTAKIAVTPELDAVKEQDEYERLSKSEPRRRGEALRRKRYHSDSETRELGPVVEKHSASLDLVAALGTSDLSLIKETFPQLYKNVYLPDLLVEEAIKHGQDKNSGSISGKVTQDIDSDFVEDTPVEEPARRVKLGLRQRPKHILEYSTDDSDVVDDTPCYDWSKKVNTKCNKSNQNNSDEIEALNNALIIKKYAKENNATNLAIDADIIDCVNDLLDKVCYKLDNCMDLLGEEQETDILGVAKNNHYRSSDTCNILKINKNTPKSTKDTLGEHDTDGAKRVTLKFKHQKQAPKMNTTRQKKSKRITLRKKVEEDTELQGSTDTKSPTNNEKQLRKKRKLYSPKDDDNEDQNSLRSRKERRPSSSTESPIAACYKELENAQKSRNRLPRKRASMQPVISPKTKNLNDMFDKIKDDVVNNVKITVVDKKSQKDLDLYNMSSESDDEAFKKKKIQIQKRVSSSSLESISKRRRSVKPVNYTPYYSSEDECHRVVEPKAVKQTKRRNRNAKKIRRTNLADERMRTQQAEVLETSFVQEKCDTHIPDEPEPTLRMPVLEEIEPDDLIDEPIISDNKSQTPKKSKIIKIKTKKSMKKKCDKLTKPTKTSKSKEIVTDAAIERESATVSPLPGLVVETEPPKDDLTSSLDMNLFQKLKKIYTEVDGLSTTRDTQNLLPNNTIDGIEVHMLNENATGNVQTMNFSDVLSEKSIATCGDSPITGHNNSDESPPNLDAMYESFQHRDVDIEGRSRSIAEFLDNMRNQTINSKAAAINTSTILGMREKVKREERTKMSSKDSTRSNVSVRKLLVETNAKPIDKSSDIRFDKTEPRERLLSKDITRMSPKDSARSVLAADKLPVKSNPKPIGLLNLSTESSSDKSNPKVLLERLSSEDIESLLNPATPKSKSSASKVLNKLALENGNIVTPNRSNTTRSSMPVVMVDRVSSDEINIWLPMPETGKIIEEPRIAKTSTRRRSVVKTCTTCEQTKPEISPVKLNFDTAELTRVTRSKTRSVKSVRSLTNVNELRIESDQSRKDLANIDKATNSQETAVKSSKPAADKNPSEMSRTDASVQSWMRNAPAESSKAGDNTAFKQMVYQEVMEMLETRLIEINKTSGEALQAAFLKDQEDLLRLIEQHDWLQEEFLSLRKKLDRIKAAIHAVSKSKMERACALVRADAEKKAKMVLLLKDDLERILK